MIHARLTAYEAVVHRLVLQIPYMTWGCWDAPGLHGRNRFPLNRLFIIQKSPPGRTAQGSWIRLHGSAYRPARRLRLEGGQSYLIPSQADLEFHFTPGLQLLAIHFGLAVLPGIDLCAGLSRVSVRSLPIGLSDRMQEYADCLAGSKGASVGVAMQLSACWYQVLGDHLQQPLEEFHRHYPLAGGWMSMFIYMDEHLGADLRIPDLARVMDLSANALSKRFRRTFGLSLKTWMSRRLVEEAATRLLDSQTSVAALAAELRFSSEFHFSRFFKQHSGSSPTAFRHAGRVWAG